ncbi:MAG TPA: flagellar biosynthesis protein FlhB [Nevskiaceae bacterium]|nr:flagellar biosynthesis protein FlhB [Nevskiaceae bacterium]
MSSEQRTERATPKREREAREKGQVARSRELTTAVLVAGGAAVLIGQGPEMVAEAAHLLRGALQFTRADLAGTEGLAAYCGRLLRAGLWVAGPVLALGFVGALLAPLLLGGWNFSAGALMPQASRVDPLAGFGRIFSGRTLVELGLGILKVLILGGIATLALWNGRGALVQLATLPPAAAMAGAGAEILALLGWLALGLAAIAALDTPYQLFKHRKQLRMTKQEIREEYKQAEGRPEVKAKLRQAQQAIARRRMMAAVPTADVIVTNPTHYAVALKYAAGTMRAPRVVAKGADLVAAAIRDLGRENKVPIVSAPPLARALYRSVELEQEIPAALFAAVAQVLTYVYQLRNWRGGSPPPKSPEVGNVPGGEADPPAP